MPVLCLCFALVINSVYFSAHYFRSFSFFAGATAFTFLELIINFILCGFVAVLLQQRLPQEKQTLQKLTLMIFCFVLISVLLKYFLCKAYEALPWFGVPFNEDRLLWVCLCIALINIFITFLMEGISRYEAWLRSTREAELLQINYHQSQLHALKSQLTPHFLFNNLNTLSSLIETDEAAAEDFLNEMTRVYRYLLQSENNTLVSLQTELQFLRSYLFLLQARFGAGLNVEIAVAAADLEKKIVPTVLQVIVEKAFYEQVLSRDRPLVIRIFSDPKSNLVIQHSRQPKKNSSLGTDSQQGLATMLRKYELLGRKITLTEDARTHTISIDLISDVTYREAAV